MELVRLYFGVESRASGSTITVTFLRVFVKGSRITKAPALVVPLTPLPQQTTKERPYGRHNMRQVRQNIGRISKIR